VPTDIANDERNQVAMLVLVNPYGVFRKQIVKPECEALISTHNNGGDFLKCFSKIFKDSNSSVRVAFFREKLVQFLWNKFLHDCHGELMTQFFPPF
jgi:hypothetical protein